MKDVIDRNDELRELARSIKDRPKGVNPLRAILLGEWEPGIFAYSPGELGVYVEAWPQPGRWGLWKVIPDPRVAADAD